MSVPSGTRLGPYEIQSAVGAGGMGEVYKARDTRLDRTVAIKVLPTDVTADPDRRARFEREARAIGALNHPHICVLHDVGDHEGSMFLVMEHLVGQTLAERLRKGALPLEQALTIATEIANALSAAHRQGIVHRDLKPGNVMLTKTGVKLLDFGLAKLTGPGEQAAALAGTSLPMQASTLTGPAVVVGTLQYMAPEQLEGRATDVRTDLWALGAILYEMVTGKRAFEGTSTASLTAAILDHAPTPIASLQPLTPPLLERLVQQCLAKSPDDRPDSAHDVASELRWLLEASGAAVGTPLHPVRHRGVRVPLVVAGLVFAAAVGAGAMWLLRPVALLVGRPSLDVRPAEEVNSGSGLVGRASQTPGGSRTAFAWTSNGQGLVFIGRQSGVQRLYQRRLDAAEARPIPSTEGAEMLAVSPDGQWVAFWANGKVTKVRLDGGPTTDVSPNTGSEPPRGLVWADGGLFYDAFPGPVIWQIPVEGQGAPRRVTDLLEGDFQQALPWPLPGGRAILYTLRKRVYSWGGEEVVAQTLATKTRKTVLRNATDARYVASGHLVFLREGRLFAVPFDPDRLEVTGNEVPVLQTVAQALTGSSADTTGAGQYAISSSGHLAWVPSATTSHPLRSLVTVDRQGRLARLPAEPRSYGAPVRLSPDGRQLAVTIGALNELGLWVYDLGRPNLTPRAVHRGDDALWPAWSRDGRQIAFLQISGRFSLVTKPADSDPSRPPTVVATGTPLSPASFSSDGHILAVRGVDDIVVITREGSVELKISTPDNQEAWPALSPDGRWLAYASDASGRMEVYVTPYSDISAANAQRVSVNGGDSPAWHPSGRELFFLSPPTRTGARQMMAANFLPTSRPPIGPPHVLFEFDSERLRFSGGPLRAYQVSPDGLFYGVEAHASRSAPVVTHINLWLNWFDELKAKVPAAR